MPKQSWLDRIVRGRAWIPVLGVLLVAIVGLRVEVLKLTSSVGSEIQQASELQSSNAALRSNVSELSGNQRIEELAEGMGMVMPGPMDVHFVRLSAGTHVMAAIRGIHAPASSAFLSDLAAERVADGSNTANALNTSAISDLPASAAGGSESSGQADTTASTSSGDAAAGSSSTAGDPTTSSGSEGGAEPADTYTATGDPATANSSGEATAGTSGESSDSSTAQTTGTASTTGLPSNAGETGTSGVAPGATSAAGSTSGGSSLAG